MSVVCEVINEIKVKLIFLLLNCGVFNSSPTAAGIVSQNHIIANLIVFYFFFSSFLLLNTAHCNLRNSYGIILPFYFKFLVKKIMSLFI